jgi:hypothetical protein
MFDGCGWWGKVSSGIPSAAGEAGSWGVSAGTSELLPPPWIADLFLTHKI